MKMALNPRRASRPFLSEVFFLFPQGFLQAGEYGAPWKKNWGGSGKKRGQKKKTTRGNIFSFTEENAGQEKCGILYKHCFSILYGLFLEEADKQKEKREMVPIWALFFLLGKKNSRNQLTRIFLFLVSAILLQVTLRRPSVSWWKLLQCSGLRLKAQPSFASCPFLSLLIYHVFTLQKKILRHLKSIVHRDTCTNEKSKLFRYDYLVTSLYLTFRSQLCII